MPFRLHSTGTRTDWSISDYSLVRWSPQMPTDLLQGLRGALGMRRIGSGMARLDEYWSKSGRLDPKHPDAPGLLCYIAQWVDAGWRDVDVVQDGLCGFPKGRRVRLTLLDYASLLRA